MNSLGASSVSFSGSLYFVPWLVILSRFFGTAHASCYFPNGTDMNTLFPQDIYLPCNGGDVDSMCCALNRNFPDKCRSDGLCLSTFDGNAWRDGCTDRTWQSPKCVSLCNSGIGRPIPLSRLTSIFRFSDANIFGMMKGIISPEPTLTEAPRQ